MNFLKIGGQQRSTKGIEYFNSEDYMLILQYYYRNVF